MKVLLPMTTNGYCTFSRHLPSYAISELMVTLEFIGAYINDLLCITQGSLDDHLLKLRQVLIRLRHAGLKENAVKCSFCATETEYFGYVLTREGIKPQPKKVEAILVLTPPQNV